jgi:Protein of unknown function (DUF2637)
MSGDRWIRRSTSAVVVAVAAFAAVVSYSHIYALGRSHGQSGTDARLLPLSVDGLILAASLVLMHEARRRRTAPGLARAMLGLGVSATVAANVAYGVVYGWLGALISAWPAIAFVGSAELAISLANRATEESPGAGAGAVPSRVPTDAESAAARAFEASLLGGNPLTQNALTSRFNITRSTARAIMNGHGQESS